MIPPRITMKPNRARLVFLPLLRTNQNALETSPSADIYSALEVQKAFRSHRKHEDLSQPVRVLVLFRKAGGHGGAR